MVKSTTTIAYKDGILAADSQQTEAEHIRMPSGPKIITLPNGMIIASAGSVKKIKKAELFLSNSDWEDHLDKGPRKLNEFEAIAYWNRQVIVFSSSIIPEVLVNPYYAVGSGWELAISRLALGGTAEEAVKFAAEHDVYTGGPIQVVKLYDEQEQKTKAQAKRVRAKRASSVG